MRRNVIFALLAVSLFVAVSAVVVAVGRQWSRPAPFQSTGQDLTAPLAPDSETDFAAAMPTIDELRQRRGSVLNGTLFDDAPAEPALADDSYIDLLRREARRLDGQAADHEDQGAYERADGLRFEATSLRQQARDLAEPPIGFSETTVTR